MTPRDGFFNTLFPDLLERLPNVRKADPVTSHAAAQKNRKKRPTQAMRILAEYLHGEYTDEEVTRHAGIPGGWKRCSDLRRLGYIAPTGKLAPTSMGVMAQVCAITHAGHTALREVE